MKFTISRLLPLQMLQTKLVKLAKYSVVFEKKMLHVTDVARHLNRRMTSYDGCQTIAIGHLRHSASSDLKIIITKIQKLHC